MPSVHADVDFVWKAGATVHMAGVSLPWKEGTTIHSQGGSYTPGSPPSGGTGAGSAPLQARFAIPAQAAYEIEHVVNVVDLRSNLPIAFLDFSFGADVDSLAWTMRATCAPEAYAILLAGEQPPQVEVTVDGQKWVFAIDSISRSRAHAETSVSISGHSLALGAASPYEAQQNWINDGASTAAQIVATANLYTTLSIDWGLEDWIVPDRVFSFSGTPLEVVKRVAESVGAIVQSERDKFGVRVFPRYPTLPNEWPVVPPDVQIAFEAVLSESYERADRPEYNGVHLSGQQQGVTGHVRLEGTNGSFLHPLVTDLLLTDEPALRQRGLSILGASGGQATVTLGLPVLAGAGKPGVLDVNQLVRVLDPAGTWYGIVRSVDVAVSLPTVEQRVTIERHTKPVPGTTAAEAAPNVVVTTGTIPPQVVTPGASVNIDVSDYVTGGKRPYTWSIRSGPLPPGLTLNTTTGVISGTPTGSGLYSVVVRATDAAFTSTETAPIEFDLGAAPAALAFPTNIPVWNMVAGTAFSFAAGPYWTGGFLPKKWTWNSGTPPLGILIDTATGAISGTPIGAAATINASIRCTDAAGNFINSNTLVIYLAAVTFSTSIPGQAFTVGVAFSANYSSNWTNKVAPVVYSVFAGTLPPGLTLNASTGVVSGTPTTSGTYNDVVLRCTDAQGNVANSNIITYTDAVSDPLYSNVFALTRLNEATTGTTVVDQKGHSTTPPSGYTDGLPTSQTSGKFGRCRQGGGSGDSTQKAFWVRGTTAELAAWHTGQWCVEGHVYFGNSSGVDHAYLFGVFRTLGLATDGGFYIYKDRFIAAEDSGHFDEQTFTAVTTAAWHHFAITMQTSGADRIYRLYIDGVLKATSTSIDYIKYVDAQCIGIGSGGPIATRYDEIRVTMGNRRYTADFTPPSAEFPNT